MQSDDSSQITQKQGEEDANSLYTHFAERVADINLQQKIAKDIFDKTILDLARSAQTHEGDSAATDLYVSRWAMLARDAVSGASVKIGFRSMSYSERARHAQSHKNRQYQWMLAEVFEEFESFVNSVYQLVNGQPAVNVSNMSASSVLRKLRSRVSELNNLERSNALGFDLALRSMVTEQMRHHIVHAKGKVREVDRFAEKILIGLGESLHGQKSAERRREALKELPLARVEGDQVIALLERSEEGSKLPVFYSTFDRYASALVTHAKLINDLTVPRLAK